MTLIAHSCISCLSFSLKIIVVDGSVLAVLVSYSPLSQSPTWFNNLLSHYLGYRGYPEDSVCVCFF